MNRREAQPVVQRFTEEYLERCRKLSSEDIVRFLEDYRTVFGAANPQTRKPNGNRRSNMGVAQE